MTLSSMTLTEFLGTLAAEGDFEVAGTEYGVTITLSLPRHGVIARVSWEELATWEKRDVITLSMDMWAQLQRLQPC